MIHEVTCLVLLEPGGPGSQPLVVFSIWCDALRRLLGKAVSVGPPDFLWLAPLVFFGGSLKDSLVVGPLSYKLVTPAWAGNCLAFVHNVFIEHKLEPGPP